MGTTALYMYIYSNYSFVMVNVLVKGNLRKNSNSCQTIDLSVHKMSHAKVIHIIIILMVVYEVSGTVAKYILTYQHLLYTEQMFRVRYTICSNRFYM